MPPRHGTTYRRPKRELAPGYSLLRRWAVRLHDLHYGATGSGTDNVGGRRGVTEHGGLWPGLGATTTRGVLLYDHPDSGNGYKVRLLLALLGRSYEFVEIDAPGGATRTAAFLAKNPNGRIPLLELDDGRLLAESNAILFWLAQGTQYWPQDDWARAQVLHWMFFEQYSHEPYIATLRYWLRHTDMSGTRALLQEDKRRGGEAALAVMEGQLRTRAFFVAERFSVADIALYAYTHVADQARISLEPYPAVRGWLDRVRAVPGYVPMFR